MKSSLSRFSDYLAENWAEHSWEEVLTAEEKLGGPSPMGSSKWQDFKDCPYKYWVKYVRRMRPRQCNEALEIGGLFHEALARYFQGHLDGGSLKEIREHAFEIVNRAHELVPDISSEVHRLLTAWMYMYHDTSYSFLDRVRGVEELVSKTKNFRYSARLDLILESVDGGAEIMDHKTARQYHENTLISYRMEPQFIGHMHLWSGSPLEAKHGPLKAYSVDLVTKTRNPTLDIVSVPIEPRKVRLWRYEMQEHQKIFNHYARMAKAWPRCTGYQCRFCELFDHCSTGGQSWAGWRRKTEGEY